MQTFEFLLLFKNILLLQPIQEEKLDVRKETMTLQE